MTLLPLVALLLTEFFVSPAGRDSNSGSRAQPFQTLERARDAARGASKPVTIWLLAGDYPRSSTLELSAADSQVSWQAAPGAKVRIHGGLLLTGWQAVEDKTVAARLQPAARRHVRVVDLQRLPPEALGRFASRGFSRPITPAHSELFFASRRMTVARWPNQSFATIAKPADATPQDDDHGRFHGRLEYGFFFEGAKPAPWKSARNVWAHGYWSWDWANSYEEVVEFDRERGFVKTKPPYGLYGFRAGQRFYLLNILEELDEPGEYYVDYDARKLYFWPPAALGTGEAALSLLGSPLVRVSGASQVSFRGMTFEYTRGTAIEVSDGEGFLLDRAVIRNVGNAAIMIAGGRRHTVNGTEIFHTGDGGIFLQGGDRKTLTPGSHSATNNRIHHIAEWSRTYQPGVRLEGVGHRVAHNLIHHSPHNGILLNGNDHLIEFNNIHHTCLETGDVGAFYMGRDYSERGNRIRFNFFHETGGVGMGSMGVYLDDCASGAEVFGNVFWKTERAVFIGGGRDNIVVNNIFVDCAPAVHLDARGLDPRPVWQNMVNRTMRERLEEVRYLEPPYILRYPLLASIAPYLAKGSGVPPEGNRIVRNICVRGRWLNVAKLVGNTPVELTPNWIDVDPRFVDEANAHFELRADSPMLQQGFEPIPWREIGPRD
jgi:hypothetical protein